MHPCRDHQRLRGVRPARWTIFVLGAASLGVPLALRVLRARIGGLPTALLLGWSLGLLATAIVPTDPIGAEMTTSGYLHRYVSVAALICLPLAVLLAVRRLAADPRWHDASV